MEKSDTIRLELTVPSHILPPFFRFLEEGTAVGVGTGCSIRSVLCGQLGISSDYLDNRIQTVFLNGKAVDDVDGSIIRPGDSLALSAAMPGLAGATLRKGGHYAAMREQISHSAPEEACTSKEGIILIKLFNLVRKELGPMFLSKGIDISGTVFQGFIDTTMTDFWRHCRSISVDGRPVENKAMKALRWGEKKVFLTVLSTGG